MREQIASVDQLHEITQAVQRGLTFDPRYGIDEHPHLGNCCEFAFRSHARLAAYEGTHLIGYSYNHAFNVGSANGMYLLSSDVPGLATHGVERDTTYGHMLPLRTIEQVQQGAVRGHVATVLGMGAVRNGIRYQDMQSVADFERKWYFESWLEAHFPVVAIMEADYAHDALTNYNVFVRGLLHNDFEEIRDGLLRLTVRTPQFETRPKYNDELPAFKSAIRFLVRSTRLSAGDLNGLVASYQQILPEKNTAANSVFGDCYKAIGKARRCSRTLKTAQRLYQMANGYSRERRSRDNPLIMSKLDRIKPLIDET